MAYFPAQTLLPPGNGLPVGARGEIMPTSPLPELNSVGGPAYAARIKGDAGAELMAILCNSGLPPRIDLINAMRNVDHPAILRLVESGTVLWPADNAHYFSFLFQRPAAPRMMQSLNEQYPVMGEDAVNNYFITPMIGALAELTRTGVVHNAIRSTNIFWRVGSSTMPQLGEAMSAPPGLGQPVLFEPLERAMSIPMGRGTGSHADDCYAFGITLALLVLGQNPLQGMDDNAIIQMKSERGSFNALVGNRRLSVSHIELLRGLLTDDARQRWTSADMEQWLNGRHMTPKSTDAGRRAARHLDFAGGQYWQLRPLAAALAAHVSETVPFVESGALDKWLRRAMGDEEHANDVIEAKSSLKDSGKGGNYEEQLTARVCIALDPSGPIRYRGLAMMPAGIANMLVEAVLTGNHIQTLSEIVNSQLVTFWVDMQKEIKTELVPLGQQYERMRGVIEKTGFGNGVERVVYELNSGIPCLSPMLRSHYVTNAKTMMTALEQVAASGNRPREPMDRHIAAFLVVRDRRSEALFEAMSLPESSPRRGIALLSLYSELQQRHGPDTMPNLAQWLLPLLEISIQRYLGRGLKEKLQTQVRESANAGNLSVLLRLIDDPKRIEHDRQDFMAARMLYLNILKEIAGIEHKLANRDMVIRSTGKPMAASLSSFLAIVLVMIAILRAVWQQFMM